MRVSICRYTCAYACMCTCKQLKSTYKINVIMTMVKSSQWQCRRRHHHHYNYRRHHRQPFCMNNLLLKIRVTIVISKTVDRTGEGHNFHKRWSGQGIQSLDSLVPPLPICSDLHSSYASKPSSYGCVLVRHRTHNCESILYTTGQPKSLD